MVMISLVSKELPARLIQVGGNSSPPKETDRSTEIASNRINWDVLVVSKGCTVTNSAKI